MKATFALLANREVYNWVRKLAWEIHQTYRTGTLHCRLPPHISLKQPFAIADLAPLEAYMAELAATIPPFTAHLTELQFDTLKGDKDAHAALLPGAVSFPGIEYATTMK